MKGQIIKILRLTETIPTRQPIIMGKNHTPKGGRGFIKCGCRGGVWVGCLESP